jgi:hypothetical protein
MRAQQPLLRAWAEAGHLVAARADDRLVAGCFLVPHPNAEWSARPGDALYLHKLVVARTHAGGALLTVSSPGASTTPGTVASLASGWIAGTGTRSFAHSTGQRAIASSRRCPRSDTRCVSSNVKSSDASAARTKHELHGIGPQVPSRRVAEVQRPSPSRTSGLSRCLRKYTRPGTGAARCGLVGSPEVGSRVVDQSSPRCRDRG